MAELFYENLFEDQIDSKVKSILANDFKQPETYTAEVLRKDSEGRWWVRFIGSDDETPIMVNKIDMRVGDIITVTVKDHQSIADGNLTSPALSAANTYGYVDRVIADVIKASEAEIGYLKADVATIGYAQIQDADITNARIQNLVYEVTTNTNHLTAVDADILELQTNSLTANSAVITNLQAQTAKVQNLTAEELEASVAYIDDLSAGNVTAADIIADHAEVADLDANYAHITDGVIDNATIGYADVDGLDANYAHITDGAIDNATIGHARVSGLSANYAHVSNGVIDNATIGYADVDGLDANYAEIDMANVNNTWIQNGTVKNAAITNEMVQSVSANKLTAGTIDASNITVTNLNADNITAGTLNGQRIGTGSLSLDKLSEDVYTEAEVDAKLDTMQAEIDGAIETWTGTDVPTLNNAPASSWTTSDDRRKHVGDVYFNTTSGYNYRFTENNNTYSWLQIKDTDITNALSRIQTAEGKIGNIEAFDVTMATFKTDTEGAISTLQTKTSTLETSLGDKVDTTTFNELSQTVEGNSSTITTLGTVLTNNGLTTSTNISNTVNSVQQTANTNSSSITSLTTTTQQLRTDLDNIEVGARNLLRWTADPEYTWTQWNSDPKNSTGWGRWNTNWTIENTDDGIKGTSLNSSQSGFAIPIVFENAVVGGVEYTISFDYKTNRTSFGDIYLLCQSGGNVAVHSNAISASTTTWAHYEQTITWSSTSGKTVRALLIPYFGTANDWFEIRDRSLKLEKGNHATDWSPAPEDLESDFTAFKTTTTNKFSTVDQSLEGIETSIGEIEETVATKADGSTVTTLTSQVNTMSDTVEGHTQSISSITSEQTSIKQNAVKSTVQLWFTKSNTTAPNKPTAHVTTNNAATGNAWNLAVPTYNSSYPNYYYCYEYEYVNGTYGWSAVTRDIATGESQATARSAASDASTAKSDAATAKADASSAVSTANTANTNASNAVSTANTANTNASNAVSTANTANTNASSAVSTANTASSTANTAKSTADTAKATADKNIRTSQQLWFTKANSTAPSKPSSKITSTATTGNAWTTKVPVYSESYPHYFYCMQYIAADGTVTWSDVVYDQATTEAQSVARTASANYTSLQTDYAEFKQTVNVFNSTIGTTYATKTELSDVAGSLEAPYTEVEWVESDGTQYVYLDWKPPIATWGFEADFIIRNAFNTAIGAWRSDTNANGFGNVFGTRNTSSVNDVQFGTYGTYGALRNGTASYTTSGLFKTDKTRQQVSYRGTSLKRGDGSTATWARTSETANKPYANMAVFAMHEGVRRSGTGQVAQPGTVRIYSLKFYDGDELKVDLVGAVRNRDRMTGLYDKVKGHFYPAKGLLCGNEVGVLGEPDTISKALDKQNISVSIDNRLISRMWEAEVPTLDRLDDGQQITVVFSTGVGGSTPNAIVAAGYDDFTGWDEGASTSYTSVYLKLTLSDGSNTGWIPCYYGQGARLTSHYGSGMPVLMTYRENVLYNATTTSAGTAVMRAWYADPNYVDGNTTYTKYSDAVIAGKNGLKPYTLCMKDDAGNWTTIVNQAATGLNDKTCYTGGLQLGAVTYHITNGTYAAGANGGQLWESYGGIDFRRSANGITDNASTTTLQLRKPVYFVGTLDDDDGLFYLDTTKWWTQDSFTTGKVYVLVGHAYTSNNAIFLSAVNPSYIWNGTKLVEFSYSRIVQNETQIIQTNNSIMSLAQANTTWTAPDGTTQTNAVASKISQNAEAITLSANKLKTVANPNLTPWFSSMPLSVSSNEYWHYVANLGTVTDMGDGWLRFQYTNSSGSTKRALEMACVVCPSVKQGGTYTWLLEMRNNHSTVTGSNYCDIYLVQADNNQFWGATAAKNLDDGSSSARTDMALKLTATVNPETGYIQRTKVAESTGSSHWTSGATQATNECARWNWNVTNGVTVDAEFRLSLYEGEYTGPWKPYSGSQLYASQAELKVANDAISARVEKNGVIAAINASVEEEGGSAVRISADKVNVEGAAIFTSGRLSSSSLSNAYDAKGAASTAEANAKNYTDAMEIGSRNLLLGAPRTYVTGNYDAYTLAFNDSLEIGQKYTVQLWDVDVSHTGKTAAQLGVFVYIGGGSCNTGVNWQGTSHFTNGHADHLTGTFTYSQSMHDASGGTNKWLSLYNSVPSASGTLTMSVGKWKLEKGSKATDWTPAPDDVFSGLVYYATCSTAAATVDKVATTTDNFALIEGAMVNVKFTYTNSGKAADLTLNVNNTGEKPIKYIYNASLTVLPGNGYLLANNVYTFRYDGANWVVQLMYNSNDTARYVNYYNSIKVNPTTAIRTASIIGGDANGLYSEVQSGSTFDLAHPILWCTANLNPNASNYANVFTQTYDRNLATCYGSFTGTANSMVFIVGTIDGNTFTVDSSVLTSVPPTTENGKFYIPIGRLGNQSTGKNYFNFQVAVPVSLYAFLDRKFRQVTPTEIVATQRIYWRTDTVGIPTAPSSWVDEDDNVYKSWTTKVPPIAESVDADTSYSYLYTCEQRKRLDGTVGCTQVLLDENTTIIDGGSIITNSIAANRLDISDVITVGGLASQEDVEGLDRYVRGEYYVLTEDATVQEGKVYYTQVIDGDSVEYTVSSATVGSSASGLYELDSIASRLEGLGVKYDTVNDKYEDVAGLYDDLDSAINDNVNGVVAKLDKVSGDVNELSGGFSQLDSDFKSVLRLASDSVTLGQISNGSYAGCRAVLTSNSVDFVNSNGEIISSYGQGAQIGRLAETHIESSGDYLLFMPATKTSKNKDMSDPAVREAVLNDAVAYIAISPNAPYESVFYMTRSVVVKDMFLGEGKWKFYKRENNNLSLKWLGGM